MGKFNDEDIDNMKKVLNGEDILESLPGECGYHYEEENWTRYSEKEKLLIRKWIRFMFYKAKRINR